MSDVPYRVEKPWGHELIWARTDRYVGKVLHIEPGHVLSLQYHNRKDETMHVLRGELILRTQPGTTLEARPFKAGNIWAPNSRRCPEILPGSASISLAASGRTHFHKATRLVNRRPG